MSASNEPDEKMPIRHELGAAMMEFVHALTENQLGYRDDVLRQVATEKYRRAVMQAAAQGVEVSLPWHTLGVWLEEGKDRIGAFSRALECLRAEKTSPLPGQIIDPWVSTHMEAECFYEIGRVHAHEGALEAAQRFLEQALPLAQKADALRDPQKITDDCLEGKIAALLLQL
jgi:hypothetical protein